MQVRAAVEDSATYLRGLMPAWELEGAMQQQRDRLVVKVRRRGGQGLSMWRMTEVTAARGGTM
jgi:hypothetical protein